MNTNELKARVDDLVQKSSDQIVQDLRTILGFQTVSGASDDAGHELYLKETERCLNWLEGRAKDLGLDWRNYDNQLAVMDLAAGESFIGLPLHIDVVPPGNGWSHGPFDGYLCETGVVYGRGTQDDKGPVIQMLHAVRILKELGIPLKRGARLIIGTAEECGDWSDIQKYFELEPAPEYSIVSDASFPVINGEKGLVNLKVRLEYGADNEPSDGGWSLISAWAGERSNIVPPICEIVFAGTSESSPDQILREVESFRIRNPEASVEYSHSESTLRLVFHGKQAHGSTPQEGHSALLDALSFLSDSSGVTDDESDLTLFLYECGANIFGQRLNIHTEHSILGPTTVNLGKLRWEDGTVEATFNIRNTMGLSTQATIEKARGVIEEFCNDTGFAFTCASDGKTLEAIYLNPAEHPDFIGALKESYEAVTARTFKEGAIGGSTYAKVFPRALCFGPVDPTGGDLELAHQIDERITVESHLRNVRIYAMALARLCGA